MQNEETKPPPLTTAKFFTSSFFIQHSAFVLIALLALAVRLPQLGERPMHTDEAINAWLIGQCLAGEGFRYDPQDRHGPALAEIALPLVRLQGAQNFAGLTETQLRLTPVLIGAATVLAFGAGVEIFGFIPCLVAALLFAFAPLPVYYGRYFIHETLFVAATLGLLLAGGRALKANSIFAAALAGGCAAFMLACKETAVLHFFAFGCAAFAGWIFCRQKIRMPSAKTFFIASVVFIFTAGLLFTWFGKNPAALADLFRAVPHLTARAGGEGHEKPFWYYPALLGGGWSGAAILAVVALGVFLALRKPDAVARFGVAVYALAIFAVYAAIPYKTPWLALNFWLPLALLAGFAIERLWLASTKPSRRAAILIGCAVLGLLIAHDTRQRVFVFPADEKNPYAYAHTTEDVLDLPVRIESAARQRRIASPRIAVVAADAWPLPWYLRKFSHVGFWQPNQETGDADFFITTTDVSGALAERLKNFRPEFFGVRPNVLLVLWTPPETAPNP